jgi:2'-5' RNA ligase
VARDRASRPEAKPLRLFVAAEVSEEAKRVVARAIEPLREAHPKARWVPEENWHVTLKFLGRTWPRLRGWVGEQVSAVAEASVPIQTGLTHLGAFSSSRRARVLWVGLEDPEGAFARLAGDLDRALAREFRAETRVFKPHLTVARSDPPLRLDPGSLDAALPVVRFVVNRMVLFRSHLGRPAPRYEALERFAFSSS